MGNDSNPPREGSVRNKTQRRFEVAEARNAIARQIVDAESKARDVRTAKLRVLRLAKEEADRLEALANPAPPVPAGRARRRRV